MAANRCGDCDYLNYRDTKWGGDRVWCNHKGYYVDPGSRACNNYTYHGHRYGRYLVTVTCEELKIDNIYDYANKFQELRDNYMIQDVNCYDFINDYDCYGLVLRKCIKSDPNKDYLVNYIFYHGIEPSIKLVEEKKYQEAFDIYSDVFYSLISYYDIELQNKQSPFIRVLN